MEHCWSPRQGRPSCAAQTTARPGIGWAGARPWGFDAVIRSLCIDPAAPNVVYAGADVGLCVSRDTGNTWERINTPFNGQMVWKVAVDPANSRRLFVGTGAPSRAVLWRTPDGGLTWSYSPVDIPEFCAGVNRPRLLAFAFDPVDPQQLWFGLEEGGLFRSRDGGDSWERVDSRLLRDFHTDIHSIHVLLNHGRKTVVMVCVNVVYRSTDEGDTWSGMLPNDTYRLYYAQASGRSPPTRRTRSSSSPERSTRCKRRRSSRSLCRGAAAAYRGDERARGMKWHVIS